MKKPMAARPKQTEEEFLAQAAIELQLVGFAVVKEVATIRGGGSGKMPCPLCGMLLGYTVAPSNGHLTARCRRGGCINAME